MTDNYDQLALSWVRKEINNTLEQAKQGLETFVEDNQDQTQIQFCINCLHQVQGTLKMLGFDGAARLASEMEVLAESLASNRGEIEESSFEILMRSIMQMPGYLERIESGQKDLPVVLLPLINELRDASGLSAVNENDFFTAATSNVEPPKPHEELTEQDKIASFQENTKKLRAHFQKGLTGIIRSKNVKECLGRVHKVLLRLEALTEGKSVSKLWWVADGFIFAIAEKGRYREKQVHLLLGKVDQQIKRLSEQGERALDDEIDEKLLSQLLYYVARSQSSNARIIKLKEEFNLIESLPESKTIKQQQKQMERPDSSAMSSAVTAITEELASVKDQLDLFVRAQTKEPSQLQSLSDSLVRIANTLTILELPIPKDVITVQTKVLQKAIDLGKLPDDSAIMDIAGALLFVDANLSNFDFESLENDDQEQPEKSLVEIGEQRSKERHIDDATIVLVGVARKNLQLAKDGMINYIASSYVKSELESVPKLLSDVLGAMKMIEFDEAAEVVEVACTFVQERLINSFSEPSEKYLEALADIITSVDYYLEGTEEGTNKKIVSILRSAKTSQSLLKDSLQNSTIIPTLESESSDSEAVLVLDGFEEAEVITEEITKVEKEVVVPILQTSAEKEVDESLIDDEVLEIFLEEASEEVETIKGALPVWMNETSNKDALSTIRRSFHTLKGSGRLVGAAVIGELSWAVENMLNKVIEEFIPAENPVFYVITDAVNQLPELVNEFSENIERQSEAVNELIARAEHITNGLNLSDFAFNTNQPELVEEIPTLSDEIDSNIDEEPIDPILLEIFVAEAQVHLKAIDQFIKTVSGKTAAVTDDLIRALHTLKGSAHMAKVEPIAKISGPIEKYARIIKGSNQRLEVDAITLVADASSFMSNVVEQLKSSQPYELDVLNDLHARIVKLASHELEIGTASDNIQQRDQQLISIFLTEGVDVLEEISALLNSLPENFNNDELTNKISSEFHVFKRGSEMVGIQEIQDLASICESVSHLRVEGKSNQYKDLLILGVESLTAMLNKIVSEEDLETPNQLMNEMQTWIDSASRIEAPSEMDQELVELFVEEADELIDTTQSLLKRWSEHLNSKDITKELRRIYHTFKGSSRMAGAMNIGDLAYAIEEIFNTHLDFGRDISAVDLHLVIKGNNKLTDMVNALRNFRWPEVASSEILELENHLNPSVEKADLNVVENKADEAGDIKEYTVEDIIQDEEHEEHEEVDLGVINEDLLSESELNSKGASVELGSDERINLDKDLELASNKEKLEPEEIEEPEEVLEVESQEVEVLPVQKDLSRDAIITEDTISPAAPIVASGNVYSINLDEDGLEILEIYLEEADELLVSLDEAMHIWSEDVGNSEAIDTLQRTLHTFKGGARLADLVVLGDLTHEMETYFEKVSIGSMQVKASHISHMLQGYDVIETLVKEVKEQNQMTLPENYFAKLKQIISGEDISEETSEELTNEESVASVEDSISIEVDNIKEQGATAEIVSFEKVKETQEQDLQQRKPSSDTVRVSSAQLENLVNLAGETSIFRSRLDQQMTVLRYNLEEMSSTVDRLKSQLRNLDIETEAQISYRREITGGTEYEDFDPLEMDRYTRQQELTRSLGESAVDLVNLKETLDSLTSDSETLLLQQGRVNTEMQESLMQTRMTPFESLVPRLRRMVRQISTELGKTIELSISADGEMDRSVLERMVAPLEHMLRNAMDHGIETPEERKSNDKTETGKIAISLYREGSEVFIKIKDDGRGLNLDAIRKKAIERGLITEATELNQYELHQLVLEAGFSTAENVTQISGRGVGMDVVNSEIKQLGGVIDIDSARGVGSTFTVRLPFTVSVNHALMVKIGEEVYAIPLANIEGIVRVSPFELEEYYGEEDTKFAYAGIDYSMYYLGQMLDHQSRANLSGVTQPLPVLLLHGADHPTALQVDDLLGSREIVVKSVGSQLSTISGISGATIQGDGRVVFILDMPALIRRVDAQIQDVMVIDEAQEEEKATTVMVVDDSITVRKVTTRLLERYNFEVITAKDGVDAVTVLAETIPDVMLLDIEMPRMDGFELATIIRHDERLKSIPIIMITSRTGEKHRDRARSIGVNQYMGKPYNEADLLETINNLLTDNTFQIESI